MKTKLFISFAACVAASVLMSGCSDEESTDTTHGQPTASLYSGHNYYMWDAAKNYWYRHEWNVADHWQPTVNGALHNGYPHFKTADGRWYHEVEGVFEASVNPLFKQLPNANEMSWYVLKGDAHWDDNTRWMAFGKIHTGGIWLKKLRVIAQENNKKLAELKKKNPNGMDLCTSYENKSYITPKKGKPAGSVIDKYFFLPALGKYYEGRLSYLGINGYYWSSTAHPGYSTYAYRLFFNSISVNLYHERCDFGFVAHPF